MLQALRNQASSWVVKILLGMLVVSFAIWGINDIFLGERDPAVAEVGGVKITRSQVNDEIREEINRLQPLFGGRLDRAEADRMGITGQVIENMVNRTAVALGARDLGVTVSDEQVARRIMSDETFFNARGQFDRNVFAQVLSRAGITEGFYVQSLKRDLAAAEISGAIQASAQVPAAMVDPLVRYRSERRTARSVRVPAPPADRIAAPSPAEIEAYYKANTQRFMAPPTRDVTYVHLDPAAIAKEIKVSDERIKQGYDERLDQFTARNRREIEQVVFQTQAAADAAAKALAAGKSLEDAAKASGAAAKPVKLGWVEKKDILPELAAPVFALKKGETTKAPVKTPLGWHLVRVTGAEEGGVKPLAEVREQVRAEIAQREAVDAIYGMVNKLDDALASGAPLDEAAKQLNLKAVRLPVLDARGRNAEGAPVEGLAATPEFLRIAFETQSGQDSQLTETAGGGFFVLHVNAAKPAEARPLDEVKDQVTAAWKAEKRAKAAEERADAIVARLKKGESLDAVAKAEKLTVKASQPFTRLTHDSESGVPAALMDKLFTLKPGEAALSEADGGYAVAVLTEVRAPTEKEKTETAQALREELRQGVAGDLFQQFVGALRGQFSIEIDRSALGPGGSGS